LGQKTHPIGFRLGVIKNWSSNWFDERNFAEKLEEDILLRRYIRRRLENAGISKIEIERTSKRVTVIIYTAKPGIVIGRKGQEVDQLMEELRRVTNKEVQVNVNEIKRPELDAFLVGENIARQLEAKISFRRAMKRSITAAMRMGAEGIKITCAGRLGGSEMARTESYKQGIIPLHTLRADIDYAIATANTTYGCIGVKVWICKGEVIGSFLE
jgi:small subunit ribosomal protein S3